MQGRRNCQDNRKQVHGNPAGLNSTARSAGELDCHLLSAHAVKAYLKKVFPLRDYLRPRPLSVIYVTGSGSEDVTTITDNCDAAPLTFATVKCWEPTLRRAAQFAVALLLLVSPTASTGGTTCCPCCSKQTAAHQRAASASCVGHTHNARRDRQSESAASRASCHICPGTSGPVGLSLVTTNRASGNALTDCDARLKGSPPVAPLPHLPESPSPLKSTSKQAIICTFLI
jgi:hypothetical protein